MPTLSSTVRAKLLVVDNSVFFRDVLADTLRKEIAQLSVDSVRSCREAAQLLNDTPDQYLAIISGLVLEDAPQGEMLDIALESNVPAIALTSALDEETRHKVMSKDVVDYFFKDPDGLHAVVSLVKRLLCNKQHQVLVVDDSPTYCTYLRVLLSRHHYSVITVNTGEEALEIINSRNDLSIVLLDYQLPKMSGFEVIRQIRKSYSAMQLPVMGISGHMDQQIPAQILKCGANDFMYKGFTVEEFYCRINNMLDFNLCQNELQALKELASA